MTMDMFGLTRDDLVEGMGEPVGAATVVAAFSEGAAPLFI
jgi:peroxiredoxin family protein